jgi:hypothetical protein
MRNLKKAIAKIAAQTQVNLRKAVSAGEMPKSIETQYLSVADAVMKVGRQRPSYCPYPEKVPLDLGRHRRKENEGISPKLDQ